MPRNRNRKRRQSAGAATSAPAAAATPSSAAVATPKRKSKGKRVAPGTAPARRAAAADVTSPDWVRVDKEVALRSAKKKATASRLGKSNGKANGKGAGAKGKKRAPQPPSDSSASDSDDSDLPTAMDGEKPLRGAKRRGAGGKAVTEEDLNAVRWVAQCF